MRIGMRFSVCPQNGLKILCILGAMTPLSLGVTGPDAIIYTHNLLISIDGINP